MSNYLPSVFEHILPGLISADTSPNRQIKKSSPKTSPTRSQVPSPLSLSPNDSKPILTLSQIVISSRKVEQFMNSILNRSVPNFQPESSMLPPSSSNSPQFSVDAHYTSFNDHLDYACTDSCIMYPDKLDGKMAETTQEGNCPTSIPSSSMTSSGELSNYLAHVLPATRDFPANYATVAEDLESSGPGLFARFLPHSLDELPVEVLFLIVHAVSDAVDLLKLSKTSRMMRNVSLEDSVWISYLKTLASQCDITLNWIAREDSVPNYLRYCAIMRWKDTYLELKLLREAILEILAAPVESRDSVQLTAYKKEFEMYFGKMCPGVSPWTRSNCVSEDLIVKLPTNIAVNAGVTPHAMQLWIGLQSGLYYHEFLQKGLHPILEFVIYLPSPVGRPILTCQTKGFYHPYLNPLTNTLNLPDRFYHLLEQHTYNSAPYIESLILQIQSTFTDIHNITEEFTL